MFKQSDLELVSLSRQGSKAAFGQLVSRYQPMAKKLALRAIGNKDLAEELVQDAMLQAYLSLDKLNDPARFKSWLYGIVLNLCRNYLRRHQIVYFPWEAAIAKLRDKPLLISSNDTDPQILAEKAEIYAHLFEAVGTLSAKNCSAIILFYCDRFSLQEVADRLNISVSAVKGRLHKSRLKLREKLSVFEPVLVNSIRETKNMTVDNCERAQLELSCSFCHKHRDRVKFLIAGPPLLGEIPIYICNECVDVCNRIINGEIKPLTEDSVEELMDSGNLSVNAGDGDRQ